MKFVAFDRASSYMRGKTVAVVGSAPSVLDNAPGIIDACDVVVRVNNYKTGRAQGFRADVHYSFYGSSIRKLRTALISDGVKLCWCKCPDAKPIESVWHEQNNKVRGIDFHYIYELRKDWWFCDTFVPTSHLFLERFELLDRHIPTTGFAAILDVLACDPASVYLTGFDFFVSGKHNVDEKWREGDPKDPIGHRPQLEADWLTLNVGKYPITLDVRLASIVKLRKETLLGTVAA